MNESTRSKLLLISVIWPMAWGMGFGIFVILGSVGGQPVFGMSNMTYQTFFDVLGVSVIVCTLWFMYTSIRMAGEA